LILAAQFMLINPWLHGIVLGVMLLGAFPQLRNYLHGRIVQFDQGISIGQRLSTPQYEGTILETERLGIGYSPVKAFIISTIPTYSLPATPS
jgi:hypothetical protein